MSPAAAAPWPFLGTFLLLSRTLSDSVELLSDFLDLKVAFLNAAGLRGRRKVLRVKFSSSSMLPQSEDSELDVASLKKICQYKKQS